MGHKSDILFVGRRYTETRFICFELFIVDFEHVFVYQETCVAVPHPTLTFSRSTIEKNEKHQFK